MMIDRMLFNIPSDKHRPEEIEELLKQHREIKFVSLVGLDIGGHDTDEKIPVELFIKDMEKFLEHVSEISRSQSGNCGDVVNFLLKLIVQLLGEHM